MSDGLEHFTHGWKANETYIHTFANANLDPGGFNWLVLGNLNLSTNAFVPVSTFDPFATPPTSGVKLISVVTTIIGVVAISPTITIGYTGIGSGTGITQFLLPEGSGPPSAKLVPFAGSDTFLYSVTSASTNHLASGTIQLLSPRYIAETFSTDWGSPDPGL
jgi:hypothetical protein